jgi:hypothetical protein
VLLAREQRAGRATALLWMALAIALMDAGWELHVQPGEFYLHRGKLAVRPAEVVGEIQSGKLSGDAWRVQCADLEIGQLRLDPTPPSH